jgi:phosphatidate cytidylyltransferase
MSELLKRFISSVILFPIFIFLILDGSIFFILFILVCLIISFYEWNNLVKKNDYIKGIGFVFLIFSFYSIYELRTKFENNYLYLLIIFLICVTTDTGGYIFGRVFKGPKLTKISPNKTYSGMIGSYVLTLLSLIIFNNLFLEETFNLKNNAIYNLLIFGTVVSFISQLGDLVISYFKRIYKIKDTGKIIPGHGGLLDRIDGMIFAFPFSYIILTNKIIEIF